MAQRYLHRTKQNEEKARASTSAKVIDCPTSDTRWRPCYFALILLIDRWVKKTF